MQWTRDQIVIDDDRARLDMPRIMGWLAPVLTIIRRACN